MPSVKVDLGGLKDLKVQLRKIVKEKAKLVDAELFAATEEMEKGAKRDAPVDNANLLEGIQNGKTGELEWTLFSNAAYSVYMEFGTKRRYKAIPGVDPSEFNTAGTGKKSGGGFYDEILEWVKRKGFAAEKTKSGKASKSLSSQIAQEQAAFAIYLSIIRHGVKPHPFFFKQLEAVKPKLIRNIQTVLND